MHLFQARDFYVEMKWEFTSWGECDVSVGRLALHQEGPFQHHTAGQRPKAAAVIHGWVLEERQDWDKVVELWSHL